MFFLFYHGVCSHRSEDAEAFEVQDGGKSTGIFTKYLNKHVLKPERVTHILEQVSEGECCYQYSSVPKFRGLPHYLYCLQLPSKGAVRSHFRGRNTVISNGIHAIVNFTWRWKRFPHADFAMGSVWIRCVYQYKVAFIESDFCVSFSLYTSTIWTMALLPTKFHSNSHFQRS